MGTRLGFSPVTKRGHFICSYCTSHLLVCVCACGGGRRRGGLVQDPECDSRSHPGRVLLSPPCPSRWKLKIPRYFSKLHRAPPRGLAPVSIKSSLTFPAGNQPFPNIQGRVCARVHNPEAVHGALGVPYNPQRTLRYAEGTRC